MVLKVRLLGSGQRSDPYAAALPTYELLHGNVTQGWALVSVPDDVHGLTTADLEHETTQETTDGVFYPTLCGECRQKVADHWARRYPGLAGRIKLDLVP